MESFCIAGSAYGYKTDRYNEYILLQIENDNDDNSENEYIIKGDWTLLDYKGDNKEEIISELYLRRYDIYKYKRDDITSKEFIDSYEAFYREGRYDAHLK